MNDRKCKKNFKGGMSIMGINARLSRVHVRMTESPTAFDAEMKVPERLCRRKKKKVRCKKKGSNTQVATQSMGISGLSNRHK